jgi:K+-sensing histidine kinase KdpD
MNAYTAPMIDEAGNRPGGADPGAEGDVQARERALAKICHDLRTPLSVVHTTTSMLLNPKYQFTPEQTKEQLERIRRNVDLLNRLVGDLSGLVGSPRTDSR